MRLAARESPAGDTLKIAVLAALNIADEFFRACDEVETDQAAFTAVPRRSNACWTSRSGEPIRPAADGGRLTPGGTAQKTPAMLAARCLHL